MILKVGKNNLEMEFTYLEGQVRIKIEDKNVWGPSSMLKNKPG